MSRTSSFLSKGAGGACCSESFLKHLLKMLCSEPAVPPEAEAPANAAGVAEEHWVGGAAAVAAAGTSSLFI